MCGKTLFPLINMVFFLFFFLFFIHSFNHVLPGRGMRLINNTVDTRKKMLIEYRYIIDAIGTTVPEYCSISS